MKLEQIKQNVVKTAHTYNSSTQEMKAQRIRIKIFLLCYTVHHETLKKQI